MDMGARNITITGFVQGVGYRWYTMGHARSCGLTGWVRNLRNGSVEVWAEGPEDDLDVFEALLKKGPPGSVVRDLKSTPAAATGRHTGFNVTY